MPPTSAVVVDKTKERKRDRDLRDHSIEDSRQPVVVAGWSSDDERIFDKEAAKIGLKWRSKSFQAKNAINNDSGVDSNENASSPDSSNNSNEKKR